MAWTLLLQRAFPDNGDFIHDWYRNAMYFTVFLYGYLVARDDGFWAEALRLRRLSLAVALTTFAVYYTLVAIVPDDIGDGMQALIWALRNLYTWTMLLAILGWSHALLNRPFRWLPWANRSVYPWYMLHQSLIVGLGFFFASWKLGPVAEAAAVLVHAVEAERHAAAHALPHVHRRHPQRPGRPGERETSRRQDCSGARCQRSRASISSAAKSISPMDVQFGSGSSVGSGRTRLCGTSELANARKFPLIG